MKFKFGSFLAGILCAALLGGLTVSAVAITGKTTIEVYPINVMVNGEVFQPTDAQGNPVDIFTYDGTTYAPLRALATAYGLEVGYDAEKKLATVTDPSKKKPEAPEVPDYLEWSNDEEESYAQFKSLWKIVPYESLGAGQTIYSGRYNGKLNYEDATNLLRQLGENRLDNFALRLAGDIATEYDLTYNSFNLTVDGYILYTIETQNGESTIYEKEAIQ